MCIATSGLDPDTRAALTIGMPREQLRSQATIRPSLPHVLSYLAGESAIVIICHVSTDDEPQVFTNLHSTAYL